MQATHRRLRWLLATAAIGLFAGALAMALTPSAEQAPVPAPTPTPATTTTTTTSTAPAPAPPRMEVGWVGGWRGDAVAFRFQSPPVEPCVRFSRTRLTDALHRRCSISPARPGGAWVR